MTPADPEAVRWRPGDEHGFEQIESHYRKLVWSICKRILLDTDEAEDATQDTFVKLWIGRDSYSSSRPIWPWLRTIAVKSCIDRLRAANRKPIRSISPQSAREIPPATLFANDSYGADTDRGAATAELRSAFYKCWERLPFDHRALLQCIDWSDWKKSRVDVAASRGVTEAALRASIIRYTRVLVECLRAQGFEPTPSELLDQLEHKTFNDGD